MFPFKGAKGAPYACFEEVNSMDDKSGNCGFKNSQLPCEHKYVYTKWLSSKTQKLHISW